MRRSMVFLMLSMFVVAGVAAACKQKQAATPDEDAGTGTNEPSTGDDDDDDSDEPRDTPAEPSNGVPCDVQAVVENRCITCHGANDAIPLTRFEDFEVKSSRDPEKTRGELSAELMKSKEMPKAPGVATDAEIKLVADWITAGMTRNTETCVLSTADAGALKDSGAPGVDAGQCTSGVRWTQGNTKSPLMHPGGACIGCHQSTQGGPALSFAGTVFPALNDVDDCNGSDSAKSPVTVVVRDRQRRTVTMQTNAVGNFMAFTETVEDIGMRPPFTVEVRQPGKPTRRMNRTITGGDCNACHTAAGANGAPGRVVEPGIALPAQQP